MSFIDVLCPDMIHTQGKQLRIQSQVIDIFILYVRTPNGLFLFNDAPILLASFELQLIADAVNVKVYVVIYKELVFWE